MNTTFIILMLLGSISAIALLIESCTVLYCNRHKDNGAYRIKLKKHICITIVLMVMTIALGVGMYFAATNCPECGAIAMHQYCEQCGSIVEANVHTCAKCGRDAYNDYCGYCGTKQGG